MPVEEVKVSRNAQAKVREAERDAKRAEQAAKSSDSEESRRSQEGKGSKVDTEA